VLCTQNGGSATWGSNPCQPIYCPAGSSSNATWPPTVSGTNGTFAWANGYFASNPYVYCKQTEGSATWGNNPCQVVCPHETSSNIAWPKPWLGPRQMSLATRATLVLPPELVCSMALGLPPMLVPLALVSHKKLKNNKLSFPLHFVALTGCFLCLFFLSPH